MECPKRKIIRLKGVAYKKLQMAVLERDEFTCQHCRAYTQSAPHHIVYRSAGGADTEKNMITICMECHRKVHAHEIKLEL